ncbi:ABC transporter [Musa troglodytarum]|uniref:ABC transporter n=1 Tax=Musa troglodytarum TaxID=320322 RepID=A0A9E7EFF6_9LILI|nr:ABC transporter [Musa troglodytarum]
MELKSGLPLMVQQYKALLRKNAILSWRHKKSASLQLFSSLFFIFLMFWMDKAIKSRFSTTTAYINVHNPEPLVDPPTPPCEDKTNSPSVAKRGKYEDPNFKFQIPLQVAAEREISRSLIGDPNFEWVVRFKEFAHPAIETFSVVAQAGPTFFLAIAMFGFVFQISYLVSEKELRLRQAMSIMGLYDSAYWLSWFTWEALLTLLAALFTVLFGMMFQFNFFLHNSFAILFLLFFLFQLNMLSFAFMISTFISKSSSATTVGFSIFIIGFLTQLVTVGVFPYSSNFSKIYRVVWSLFPPNLLAKALGLLGNATATSEGKGISWHNRGECTTFEPNCVITIEDIYRWLISTFFLWFILAIYFDNIIPNSNGVRKSIFYFLSPSYWTGKDGNKDIEGGLCSCSGSIRPWDDATPNDEDLLTEEIDVEQQAANGEVVTNVAVQIHGLTKTYKGTNKIRCCKCNRSSPCHAVKEIWVNLAKDQLFCLLGPNGAGKTTLINCLTGITPVTGGDALIYGYSVRSSVGMSNIRRMIGVCPQFDILWDELSALEHLHLFASIKGLPPSTIKYVAEKSLADVKLIAAARIRSGSYSGGMKRRLSVAIALIGDPKLVFLDEPTAGMDPITRRHVWDIIEDAKRGRAIVLTTHSTEEADILSDRIAIMAKGQLWWGQTHNVYGNTPVYNPDLELVKQFFKDRLNVEPKEEKETFLTFTIPYDKEKLLANFFVELQDREKEFGILDIQLGLTTLEEVFLKMARPAELDSSSTEDLVTLDLSPRFTIQVPKLARFVGIPGTESSEHPRGLMVEISWGEDDIGKPCIYAHKPVTGVPRSAVVIENDEPSHRGLSDVPVGYLIDLRRF